MVTFVAITFTTSETVKYFINLFKLCEKITQFLLKNNHPKIMSTLSQLLRFFLLFLVILLAQQIVKTIQTKTEDTSFCSKIMCRHQRNTLELYNFQRNSYCLFCGFQRHMLLLHITSIVDEIF